jgi:amylosucrase
MRHILSRRKETPELHGANPTVIADSGNAKVFAFVRETPASATLCLFNFTEDWTSVSGDWARAKGVSNFDDALSDAEVKLDEGQILLPPYARVWLQ